jgi:hypothetical protein
MAIKQLIDLRDEIVHRGRFAAGADRWPMIIRVRELITRILLSALGLRGQYRWYVGGVHDRDFATTVTALPRSEVASN